MKVTELSGNRFPDLETAQRAARSALAADLAATIRALLAAGVLVIKDGQIVPKSER